MLRILVPVVLILTWIPDVLAASRQPGATPTSIVALMIMHVVVVAVAVPVYNRIAPVNRTAS